MTLNEFYIKCVLPLMAEKQSAAGAYGEQFVAVVNAVLTELAPLNDRLRLAAGEEAPGVRLYAAADELPFDRGLLMGCAAYGCAARLYVDEAGDEANMVGFLESCYEAGKTRFTKAEYVAVKRTFGREE